MIRTLLEWLAPPWHLPTAKEVAVTILVVALARGWYDEHQKYEDMVSVAEAATGGQYECQVVTGARLKLTEERLAVAIDRQTVLTAWLEGVGVALPERTVMEVRP
jgi:hypothetical protein